MREYIYYDKTLKSFNSHEVLCNNQYQFKIQYFSYSTVKIALVNGILLFLQCEKFTVRKECRKTPRLLFFSLVQQIHDKKKFQERRVYWGLCLRRNVVRHVTEGMVARADDGNAIDHCYVLCTCGGVFLDTITVQSTFHRLKTKIKEVHRG